MMFVKLTIRSHDEFNGKNLYAHPEDVRSMVPGHKVYKDKIPEIGETPAITTIVRLASGQLQVVLETPEEIAQSVQEALRQREQTKYDVGVPSTAPSKKRTKDFIVT